MNDTLTREFIEDILTHSYRNYSREILEALCRLALKAPQVTRGAELPVDQTKSPASSDGAGQVMSGGNCADHTAWRRGELNLLTEIHPEADGATDAPLRRITYSALQATKSAIQRVFQIGYKKLLH